MTRNLKIRVKFSFFSKIKNAVDIKKLDLNFNLSTHIFAGIAEAFPNLEHLKIHDQQIKFIERENFANLSQLEELRLYHNKIEFLPDDIFNDVPNLKVLDLVHNRIKILPEKVFNKLWRVGEMYLNNNKIEHLSKNLFINNVELFMLQLDENSLKTIDDDFTKLPKLMFLNLRNANCVSFTVMSKSKISEMQEVIKQNCTAKKNRIK